MIDVIIPARNEQRTIGEILRILHNHAFISKVIVCVDAKTRDMTHSIAHEWADIVIPQSRGFAGKGQLITEGLRYVSTPYVMLCDADYTGFDILHATIMTSNLKPLTVKIGIPDYPDKDVPPRVISTWPWVSGIRVVPLELIQPLTLHGYLTEVQINEAAARQRYHFRFKFLPGLKSEYLLTKQRMDEMERDREWGKVHGIL